MRWGLAPPANTYYISLANDLIYRKHLMRVPLFFQMIKKSQNPKFWPPLWRHVQEVSPPFSTHPNCMSKRFCPLRNTSKFFCPPLNSKNKNDYNTHKTHINFFHAHSKIQVHDGGAPLSWEISFFAPLSDASKIFCPHPQLQRVQNFKPPPPGGAAPKSRK